MGPRKAPTPPPTDQVKPDPPPAPPNRRTVIPVPPDDSLVASRAAAQARWDLFMSGRVADRAEIVACFATLPDEAFAYVAFQVWQTAKASGGFNADSQDALQAFSAACDRWMAQKRSQANFAKAIGV